MRRFGDPFACNLPNAGAFLLCDWTRRFAVNAVLVAGALVVCAVAMALPLAVLRAGARRFRS